MKTLLLFCTIAFSSTLFGQWGWYTQYFDGADTIPGESLFFELDSSSTNLWLIGPPQKTIFDSALTDSNVLVTDNKDLLPDSTESSFYFSIKDNNMVGGYFAVQWAQQLDLDGNADIGMVEYSKDTGNTWINAFQSPYLYNFYGYQAENHGWQYNSADEGFIGQDTVWRDIWLCFNYDFLNWNDTIIFKYTIRTDSSDNQFEGWMIDNFSVHPTFFHTIVENSRSHSFKVYPTSTPGPISVACMKTDPKPDIAYVEIVDLTGKVVEKFKPQGVNFNRDFSHYSNGTYKMKVVTKMGFDVQTFIIQH